MIQGIKRFCLSGGREGLYLLLLSALCYALLIARMLRTHTTEDLFLGFNLLLAWLPYVFARIMVLLRGRARPLLFPLAICWLLFFPNALYIVTDLCHLYDHPDMPVSYDAVLFALFAWCAMLLGLLSLRDVMLRVFPRSGISLRIIVTVMLLFLGGMGVYFGRYGRWNSWDAVTQPVALGRWCLQTVAIPAQLEAILCTGILFLLVSGLLYIPLIFRNNLFSHKNKVL